MYYGIKQYKLLICLFPALLLLIRFRSVDHNAIHSDNGSERGIKDWQQFQSDIWLKKCLANPEVYEADIDHTKCKCCGKYGIIAKRKGRKKKAMEAIT